MRSWTNLLGLVAVSSFAQAYYIESLPACDKLNERKSWNNLTDTEKHAYIKAEKCLMNHKPVLGTVNGAQSLWDEFDYNHINQANDIHYVGQFLPWHRYYVRAHEILLQEVCNYTGAHPYWDELTDWENGPVQNSSIFDPVTGFGGNGTGSDSCLQNGPFANTTLHINQTGGVESYCLARDLSQTNFDEANGTLLQDCYNEPNYTTAWSCFNGYPHGAGHGAVGGTMLNPITSSGDPTFFMHHAYLDRVWWKWQEMDLPARLYEMGGNNTPPDWVLEEGDLDYPSASILDYDGDNGTTTTLNHTLWMTNLVPNTTVGKIMNLTGPVICATYVD